MSKGRFGPIKREMLETNPDDSEKVRTVIRILSMNARERIRAFERGRFNESMWEFFGDLTRKYAASRNFCRRMARSGLRIYRAY